MVLNQKGIFDRTEQAVGKHGQAKARETLELALGEAQMQKYEEGLTDEQLTEKINEIGEEIEERENPDISQAIVEGYIFSVDRTVPKILDYLGPADGIIITAKVSGNGGWFKQGDTTNVTVTGKIKTYSGGTITNVSATKGETAITGFSIDGDGKYEITGITSNTTIEIYAKDSNNKENSRTIPITIKVDGTAPVLSNAKAEADRMKIKISVNATDDLSGIAQIKYKIEPNTLDITTPEEGILQSGVEKEIITKVEGEYTVTFTATDKAGNPATPVTAKATTVDAMTVDEVKSTVNASNIADYIGKKVIDYEEKAIWRVFYYDAETTDYPKGYFGDGDGAGPREGTVYLKRDFDSTKIINLYDNYRSATPSTEAVEYMKQLNPLWREAENGKKEISNYLDNERMSASFYEQRRYGSNKNDTYSTYIVGAPPIEMWTKAYDIYKNKYEPNNNTIDCDIKNSYGYGYKIGTSSLVDEQSVTVVNTSIEQSKVIAIAPIKACSQWLASPSSVYFNRVGMVDSEKMSHEANGLCYYFPVVPLDK